MLLDCSHTYVHTRYLDRQIAYRKFRQKRVSDPIITCCGSVSRDFFVHFSEFREQTQVRVFFDE
jgi:hypothetical protein